MSEPTGYVRTYLAPDAGAPWRWAEDGRVLTWVDGGTIAFRPEIERVLRRLATESQVVPPFLELVLLFAALRSEPRGALGEARIAWMATRIEACAVGSGSKSAAMTGLAEVVSALRVIAHVPVEFWSNDSAIENLAVHVVERSGRTRDPHAATLLTRTLEHGLPPWSFTTTPRGHASELERWIETFTFLRHGLSRFDASALVLRARTGLEQVPGAVDVPIDSRAGARDLIETLRDDAELGALAAIAREVAALVHVPRPMADRSDLPSGGVSDISNRGSLERLLSSELAHDDLTLAIRVATNEALYTRRESPSRPRSGTRSIVVDVGIRSWGTPRVFAAAVTLGLAAATDRHDRAWVWRTGGSPLTRVDLSSREGLVEFLSALDPDPDPAEAFDSVFDATRDVGTSREIFFVVTREAAESREVRARLAERASEGYFLVIVDAAGMLRVDNVGPRGTRVIHESQLDVAAMRRAVLASSDTTHSRGEEDVDVPSFLLMRPFPLRVPPREDRSRFCRHVSETRTSDFVLTTQGDLQAWEERDKGGRVITTIGNGMRVALCDVDEDGHVHVVFAEKKTGPWRWLRVDPSTLDERTHSLPGDLLHESAVLLDGRLVLIGNGRLTVVDDASDRPRGIGELHVQSAVECGQHLQGRYFRRERQLSALTLTAGVPQFVRTTSRMERTDDVIALFDWPGRDGPWAISKGSPLVVSTATGDAVAVRGLNLPRCASLQFASSRFVVLNLSLVVDVERGVAFRYSSPPRTGFTAHREASFTTLRSIGRSADGNLMVSSQSSKNYELRLHESQRPPRLVVARVPKGGSLRHSFAKRGSPWNGYRVASSARGAVAWTDWRGWLHLKSSDPSVPELTVALVHDRPLRAWCSEGWSHGDEAFLLEGPTRGADEVASWLRVYAEAFQ